MAIPFLSSKMPIRNFIILITAVWIVYLVLTFMAPSSEAQVRYGLTYTQLSAIRISYLLPYLLIWIAAIYAVVKFRRYAHLVEGSPESRSYKQISLGIIYLFLALIIPTFIGLFIAFDPGNPNTQKIVTIIRNYVTIILYYVAFWYLRYGSKMLSASIGNSSTIIRNRKMIYGLVTILGTLFIYTVFQNQFRGVSVDPLIRSTYFLPDALIIITIIIPYIFIWLWGSLAILNFWTLSRTVNGIVYKQAFADTAFGLIAIIGLTISIQFLSQLSNFFAQTRLSIILTIIYLILIIMSVGYFFIAKGVKALSAIEEYEND